MNIDSEFLKKTLVGLTGIDSPSGYCDKAIAYVGEIAASLGYRFGVTNKGCGVIYVDGREKGKKVGLAAHTDTLGLMVRSICADGKIKFTKIGGPQLPTLDGEYCRIHTRDGRLYTGGA